MTETISISPAAGPIHGSIRPPGSKSITNRALVCAALADGSSVLDGVLCSEDTEVMVDCLRKLGIDLTTDWPRSMLRITGCAGQLPVGRADLYVANSGTTIRFLTALVALGNGDYRLEGIARMHERPIGDLADALSQLGADVQCESPRRCPPVRVRTAGLRGGGVTVRGDISSQFLSGLLLAAPYAADRVEILVDGPLVSKPYVSMTTEVMRAFGVLVEQPTPQTFCIDGGQKFVARNYSVEPDASAASYFWAAAAITGGEVVVEGLSRDSLQGDVAFCDCLAEMGCRVQFQDHKITVQGGPLHGVDVDMNAISDTAQTLAVVALFANGPTTIRGVGHIRHKESDRIGDLARELRKLGGHVDELPDGVRIVPGPLRSAELETYNDHRMAMSLGLAGLRTNGVVIRNPQCTSKTYPGFFSDLAGLAKTS